MILVGVRRRPYFGGVHCSAKQFLRDTYSRIGFNFIVAITYLIAVSARYQLHIHTQTIIYCLPELRVSIRTNAEKRTWENAVRVAVTIGMPVREISCRGRGGELSRSFLFSIAAAERPDINLLGVFISHFFFLSLPKLTAALEIECILIANSIKKFTNREVFISDYSVRFWIRILIALDISMQRNAFSSASKKLKIGRDKAKKRSKRNRTVCTLHIHDDLRFSAFSHLLTDRCMSELVSRTSRRLC